METTKPKYLSELPGKPTWASSVNCVVAASERLLGSNSWGGNMGTCIQLKQFLKALMWKKTEVSGKDHSRRGRRCRAKPQDPQSPPLSPPCFAQRHGCKCPILAPDQNSPDGEEWTERRLGWKKDMKKWILPCSHSILKRLQEERIEFTSLPEKKVGRDEGWVEWWWSLLYLSPHSSQSTFTHRFKGASPLPGWCCRHFIDE